MLARTGPRGRCPTCRRVVGALRRDGSPAGRSGPVLRCGGRGTGPDRSGSSLVYAGSLRPGASPVSGRVSGRASGDAGAEVGDDGNRLARASPTAPPPAPVPAPAPAPVGRGPSPRGCSAVGAPSGLRGPLG